MNETYISLIAKKDKCRTDADYRPINLTTSVYKILAKTLATRVKLLLPHTISSHQMAFIDER